MIIGFDGNNILKCNIKTHSNRVELEIEKGVLDHIESFINSFNVEPIENKANNIGFNEENSEDEVREKFKSFILENTNTSNITLDSFSFSNELFENIRNYKGKSIDIIDNMRYMINRTLPEEVMNVVNTQYQNIEEIDLTKIDLQTLVTGVSEYVVYMGTNTKYRGCIGKVVNHRDDVASELVEFPNKFRDSGRIARFWSKPENIVHLNE